MERAGDERHGRQSREGSGRAQRDLPRYKAGVGFLGRKTKERHVPVPLQRGKTAAQVPLAPKVNTVFAEGSSRFS